MWSLKKKSELDLQNSHWRDGGGHHPEVIKIHKDLQGSSPLIFCLGSPLCLERGFCKDPEYKCSFHRYLQIFC